MEHDRTVHGSRKCPFCAELIKREAIVCKHCGRDTELDEANCQSWMGTILEAADLAKLMKLAALVVLGLATGTIELVLLLLLIGYMA